MIVQNHRLNHTLSGRHHWPASPRWDSTLSNDDRGEDWLQRPQPEPKSTRLYSVRCCYQIATCRPISTTSSHGSLKKSLTCTAFRSIAAKRASSHLAMPVPYSRGTIVSWPT